ncbi:LOW QUALITY PROTEIN: pentatricopeptide repeat-containing protein At2g36730-like [Argentina anserina]|uniref:LOW QUALITY PROTEIN: pentatricopeptide repeat-containing protein At2g36730-like n=1 Tax=Argentina anserina TaxID=57926 RepID=UPI0021768525|nr:LOW QUALITY PROTEIN: pentatricopeptide repeat-containing protein At2g36730-like [Potentilla anserina]
MQMYLHHYYSIAREGRQAHGCVVKLGLEFDLYVQNNLVHFYGVCKKIKDAVKVFDGMPERSVVSWNVVVTACVDNLPVNDGIGYFVRMGECGFEPDETTVVVVLNACSELGRLSLGRGVHSYVMLRRFVLNCQLGTALVDMYAKSGDLDCARLVFDRMEGRNVWTWSAMTLGLAQHGFVEEALELFQKMLNSSVCPNYVTFLGVLCSCSHAGLVDDEYRYFYDREHVYGITPMMIHYGAMEVAYSFMKSMPCELCPIICRTLLSACSTHDVNDELGIANKVIENLLELEPSRSGNLVMVANFLVETGMWDKAASLRKVMKEKRMKKRAGESSVELGGSIHKFFSGYDSRSDYEDIFGILDVLSSHMKLDDM